jgi:hypothetical protein
MDTVNRGVKPGLGTSGVGFPDSGIENEKPVPSRQCTVVDVKSTSNVEQLSRVVSPYGDIGKAVSVGSRRL